MALFEELDERTGAFKVEFVPAVEEAAGLEAKLLAHPQEMHWKRDFVESPLGASGRDCSGAWSKPNLKSERTGASYHDSLFQRHTQVNHDLIADWFRQIQKTRKIENFVWGA